MGKLISVIVSHSTVITIIASLFVLVATMGFLLLQSLNIFEGKIAKKREDNVELISNQQKIVEWMEKANSYRELASLSADHIEILKSVNPPSGLVQKRENDHLYLLQTSAVYTINALSAAKIINEDQGDKQVKDISMMSIDKSKNLYKSNMELAAEATIKVGKTINANKIDILKLEQRKNFWWYICFSFQSLGLMLLFLLQLFPVALPKI